MVVSSPTFFSIGSAWLLARLKRARLVVEVRDLWPAIFVELGVLTNRRVIGLLERLELAAYAAADQVVVVSDGFRANLIDRGVPEARSTRSATVSRWPGSRRAPRPDPRRARLGARPGDCLVLYAGTHGISHALPGVADAAAAGRRSRFMSRSSATARTSPGCSTGSPNSVSITSPWLPGVPPEEIPGCWPRPTSAWCPCATCRCSRRSSRRRCSSTWPHPAGDRRGGRRVRADPA